jgi:aspartate aminotransferase
LKPADRLQNVELSLIRQINALATPLSINLGIGEPNLVPDAHLRELAARAATTGWQYSANPGRPSLRSAIAKKRGYEPGEVCVTAGTQEALFSIFQAWVNPGDEVLLPNPGFVAYATLAQIAGATIVYYDLEPPDWQLQAPAVLSKITPRTKLIVVNSPSNPLGATADSVVLQEIAESGPIVVSDEVYREIWYEAPPASMAGMSENVIVIDGMSKSHGMTGLRLGWAMADERLLNPVIRAHQYIATCASVFSQALAESILTDNGWNDAWLRRVRDQFRIQRDACVQAITRELEVDFVAPAAAFYAFAPVPSCDTLTFAKSLATDSAVLVIPGVAFGSAGEGFVRISCAAPVEHIEKGIERIGRHLRTRGR